MNIKYINSRNMIFSLYNTQWWSREGIHISKDGLKKGSARWSHEATVNFVVSSIRNMRSCFRMGPLLERVGGFSSSATAQFTRCILELFCSPFPETPSPSLGHALQHRTALTLVFSSPWPADSCGPQTTSKSSLRSNRKVSPLLEDLSFSCTGTDFYFKIYPGSIIWEKVVNFDLII